METSILVISQYRAFGDQSTGEILYPIEQVDSTSSSRKNMDIFVEEQKSKGRGIEPVRKEQCSRLC